MDFLPSLFIALAVIVVLVLRTRAYMITRKRRNGDDEHPKTGE